MHPLLDLRHTSQQRAGVLVITGPDRQGGCVAEHESKIVLKGPARPGLRDESLENAGGFVRDGPCGGQVVGCQQCRRRVERDRQLVLSGWIIRPGGRLTPQGIEVFEIAPGIDLQRDVLDRMDFAPRVARDLKVMDAAHFRA